MNINKSNINFTIVYCIESNKARSMIMYLESARFSVSVHMQCPLDRDRIHDGKNYETYRQIHSTFFYFEELYLFTNHFTIYWTLYVQHNETC